MRLTQSLVDPDELRLVCYVDDPFAAIRGTPERQRLIATMMILVWNALGFKLAFSKGQFGIKITWIGITITVEEKGIRAKVKQEIIEDILCDLERFSTENVITKKCLHSMLGKLSHVSGLLVVMRPFIEPMWKAWGSPSPADKPGCIWRAQIQTELDWFTAFFTGKGTSMERFFSVDAYNRVGTIIEIGTDASCWGLGGWLAVDGIITEYFSSPLGPLDVAKYGFAIGNNKGQQVWEALAILVAIDLWSKQWNRDRIVLKVRGDNVTALVLLIKMRPKVTKTPGETHDAVKASKLAIVARELALRLVDLSFPPDGEHTPASATSSRTCCHELMRRRRIKAWMASYYRRRIHQWQRRRGWTLHPATPNGTRSSSPTARRGSGSFRPLPQRSQWCGRPAAA